MSVLRGSDFQLFVETAVSGTFIAVNDMNKFGKSVSKSSNSFPVFMRTTPYNVAGPREASYDVTGYFNGEDPGQERIRAQELADAPVNIKVMYDGTNGFTQSCNVTSYSYDAESGSGLQTYGFNLAAAADAVVVGAGPIL